jgi:hypothetical protein
MHPSTCQAAVRAHATNEHPPMIPTSVNLLRLCRPSAESHVDHGLGFVSFNVTLAARLTSEVRVANEV